ncbi:hydroxyacid dehydrogenase [Acinetobacter sp. IRS14]|uniref:hydroxyacid dehydrogenase n=1 Tax=Acinetobacter sp. IRS14 TaxID=2983398 RepID=UPI002AFF71A0|nr:hydroxyacid dehydrogenase [Acinetobacter sp. IRS14]MEA1230504.1 hydroxyacid dehydrogenase [Acinetobacter sp. IRS14]
MQVKMKRKVLITGPTLTSDALLYAQSHDIQLIPTEPYMAKDEMEKLIHDEQPDAIIVRTGKLSRDMIFASDNLKVIAKHGVGFDTIDTQAAAERKIPVTIAVGANAQSVAEHAFALMFNVARQVTWLDQRIREGHWDKASANGVELYGKTLGLIGLGAIGSILMKLVAPLNMKVKVYDPFLQNLPELDYVKQEHDFEKLLETSDIISLHCPLTAENRHLFSHAQFEKMKRSSILINTARGELIDQAALVDALKNNKIAGAGLDTFSSEPPEKDNPLWELPNLVVTPHIGANTTDSRNRVGLLALEQIVSIWDGQLLNPRAIANWKLLNS